MVYLEKRFVDTKLYCEISCDSSESKPTGNICNGSIAVESDTGKVFFFNEATGAWVEQFSFQS